MTQPQQRQRPPLFQLAIAGILILVGVVSGYQLFSHQTEPTIPAEEALRGVVLPQPIPLTPFQLVDHLGQPFDLERLKGRWSFLFFGYTHCPDVCPLSMSLLVEMYGHLPASSQILADTHTYFVSVDPKRDTLAVLKDYVPYFHADFMGVTGGPEALRGFSKQVHAIYEFSPEVDGEYSVDHSSAFYLIDPEGRFYALFQSQFHNPEQMAKAYLQIRGG
ncbi:MAG: SCO family protein [Magnetococcales bacterium]|nr:SCO family protein [Magnetococcales bacterium]